MNMTLLLLTIALLKVSFADHNPGCSKEWIRYLIVNACNYSKRDAEIVVQYVIEEDIEEVKKEFQKIVHTSSSGTGKENVTSNKTFSEERVSLTLSTDTLERGMASSLMFASIDDLMHKVNQDKESWERKRRSIRKLVEKCCIKLCEIDEFKGLCFS